MRRRSARLHATSRGKSDKFLTRACPCGVTSTSILPQPLSLNNYPSNIYASKLIEFVFGLDDKASSLFAPSAPHPKHAGSVRAVHLGAANKCLGRTAYHNHELFVPSYSASPYSMRTDVLLLDAEFFLFHGSVKVRTTAGHWFLTILACQHAERDEGAISPRLLRRAIYF